MAWVADEQATHNVRLGPFRRNSEARRPAAALAMVVGITNGFGRSPGWRKQPR